MVPGVSAGERPRRPTSPATSAGGERQHHTARLHIHARSTSTTSTIRKTSHLHHPYSHRVYDGTLYSSAYFEKGYTPHQAAQLHRWIVKHGFTKSILQSDAETSLMQLVNTVSTDLKLTYKSLTSLLTSESREGSTGTSLTNFAQQGYNGAKTSKLNLTCCLQSHFLGHFNTASSSSTTTSYTLQAKHPTSRTTATTTAPNIVGFGEIVLGDVHNIPTHKLHLRNQHQKLRGIWIGRDLITNEHFPALLLQYSEHPSTTTGAYRCRQITRVPREEQHDFNFLKDIYWPQLSDDIDFNTREHFNNLQKQNIATRDLQLQQPQDEEDIEQPQGVRPPILRHHPQAVHHNKINHHN